MIITAPGGILEAPIIRQGRTVSTATAPQPAPGDSRSRGGGRIQQSWARPAYICVSVQKYSLCAK